MPPWKAALDDENIAAVLTFGMFKTCPTRNVAVFFVPFASSRSVTVTPYCAAIFVRLSPATTRWVRVAAMGGTAGSTVLGRGAGWIDGARSARNDGAGARNGEAGSADGAGFATDVEEEIGSCALRCALMLLNA